MPIKDPSIYPPYWKQFSLYIRKERAGDKCEQCEISNGIENWRGSIVVLTVAHLDNEGGICDCKARTGLKCANPAHVKALCQACHLRLDLPKHIENRRQSLMQSRQPDLFRIDSKSARFSSDRVYRYTLWRRWSEGKRYVNFICLNPSTADETRDDPTIRKCVKFARTWGFDAMCMTNLFAYRSSDKNKMLQFSDPVGYGNDHWLLHTAKNASIIVAAWSRDGGFNNRAGNVCNLLANYDLYCLRITLIHPWHPLYLPDVTRPRLWRPAQSPAAAICNKGKFNFSNSKNNERR